MKEMPSRDTRHVNTGRMTCCFNPKCGGLCYQDRSFNWVCPSCGMVFKTDKIHIAVMDEAENYQQV